MSGYYVPKLSRFHQRAPGQVVKPSLVDYYDYAYTKYMNEEVLPGMPSYPTFPKYTLPDSLSPQQKLPASMGNDNGSGVSQKYSSGITFLGENKILLIGMVVVAGIVVMTILKKSGKFQLFEAETFDANDFEEMDQPYESKDNTNSPTSPAEVDSNGLSQKKT